jgi:hypothetical protein
VPDDARRLQDAALQRGIVPDLLRRESTARGMACQRVTQVTSVVAVEKLTVTWGGAPITIAVPVDRPAGVSDEGVFGQPMATASAQSRPIMALSPTAMALKSLAHFRGSAAVVRSSPFITLPRLAIFCWTGPPNCVE